MASFMTTELHSSHQYHANCMSERRYDICNQSSPFKPESLVVDKSIWAYHYENTRKQSQRWAQRV
ncbi:uncharacterized protein RAG0_03770 [Rhynchosporium agropyri]|uniref:Uncharacterized protein n=1 Tax=Rhynchosporium agropyri TaxID=914238 RepID=A0A1E1K640_9HELO|nr:uncharacterized protein RAG0_03770 [Rhynchosporium agropyri]